MPSLLGAGVLALVVRHSNSEYVTSDGYVIQNPADDIAELPAENLVLAQARAKCDGNPDCNAISYSGSDPNPKVYYKRSADNIYNDCWKSYSRQNNWREEDGFLPAGSDDLKTCGESKPCTMAEAQRMCEGESACKGFTGRVGTDVYYLKKAYSQPHQDCWKTLIKGGASGESEGAPTYYGESGAVEAPTYYGESGAAPTYYGAEAQAEQAAAPTYYGAAEESAALPTYY